MPYPSKLLLFGEYAIIAGGEGLAIPYPAYSGEWKFGEGEEYISLRGFCNYLRQFDTLLAQINVEAFSADIEKQEYFNSSIPQGYGLGSSGALTAAVYNRYATAPLHRKTEIDLIGLKSVLASMENYFHTGSSGLDPLVSLLQKPVRLHADNTIEIIPHLPDSDNYSVALYNTGKSRQTAALVSAFYEKMEEPVFNAAIKNEYLPLVAHCIKNYLVQDANKLKASLLLLSAFQLRYFSFAIPMEMQLQWENALDSGNELFKLCGAGGGGFMIRFVF